jgi:beta-fructofuranosidase
MKPTFWNFLIVAVFTLLLFRQSAIAQPDSPPYISAVPKFTFPQNLDDQITTLQSNPLILRFAESRKKIARDPQSKNRPVYHMTPPEGRLGDPNGLCFWNGNWHLFYQAFPPEDSRQHWGHIVSKDLVHWQDLPYAIYPGPERSVYSGSTLVEKNRVIAIYHGTAVGNMVALSNDPLLLNWDKLTGNAVIPTKSSTGFSLPYVVFDPCIFRNDSVYYALSGGKSATSEWGKPVASAYVFRSKDLSHWEYLHPFVEGDRFTMIGDDYACPYFWPIGDRYIMNFFSHNSGGQFLIGDYDHGKQKFNPAFGSGPAALGPPSSTPDGKGGVIVVYTGGGVLLTPRRLRLIGKDSILQEPAADYSSLRYDPKRMASRIIPRNQEIVLDGISGNAMEMELEIDPKNAQMIELNVLRSPNREEYTRIIFYNRKGYGQGLNYVAAPETALMPADLVRLFTGEPASVPLRPAGGQGGRAVTATGRFQNSLISIDPVFSSSSENSIFRAPVSMPFAFYPNEILRLHIFIDKSLVEVFVNGKQAVAVTVSPDRNDSKGVSIRSQGQDVELKSLEAWQMRSIYENPPSSGSKK